MPDGFDQPPLTELTAVHVVIIEPFSEYPGRHVKLRDSPIVPPDRFGASEFDGGIEGGCTDVQ